MVPLPRGDLPAGRLGLPSPPATPGQAGTLGESRSLDPSGPESVGARPLLVDAGTLVALYEATVDATEEAIVNALFAAETMTGRDGITAHALPIERVLELMSTGGPPS